MEKGYKIYRLLLWRNNKCLVVANNHRNNTYLEYSLPYILLKEDKNRFDIGVWRIKKNNK